MNSRFHILLFSAAALVLASPLLALADSHLVILTSGTSWTVPTNWDPNNNTIEVVGGGGGGGWNGRGGGGGGAYSKISNLTLTPGAGVFYRAGSGGGAGGAPGQNGNDSYFNGATCASSSVCAKGGQGGSDPSADGFSGGAGGASSGGVGTTKYSGGRGGTENGSSHAGGGGGGGAAGPHGGGVNGDDATDVYGMNGGHGDSAYGGLGGYGHYGGNIRAGMPGNNGSEFDSYGAGGGGGGGDYYGVDNAFYPPYANGGAGGYYGGGGGGAGSGSEDPAGGDGAPGIVVITWSDRPATCSITFDTNPLNYGSGTYLRWTSTAADYWVYISNVGYVGGSGAIWVGPLSTTNYACEAYGYGGTDGWHNGILTVNAPASCTFNGSTVAHGASVTAYQATTVPYGSSCVSQQRTCSNGSLSGSYQFASCNRDCTFNGAAVPHGTSVTAYQSETVPYGSSCASQTRTCSNGTFSGSYGYASCSVTCTPATSYSCSGDNVVETATTSQCAVTTTNPYATCSPPAFCSPGSATCLNPSPIFNIHLQARPKLVKKGETVRLYWDIGNVLSCTVTGNNESAKSGLTSGPSGTGSDDSVDDAEYR